jgi:hypothetical protein
MAEGRRVRARQHGAQRRDAAGHPLATRARPVPGLGFEHPAADRADDERRPATLAPIESGIVEGLAGGGQRQAIGSRATGRPADDFRHFAGETAAKLLGFEECERPDGTGTCREPGPV